MGKIEFTEQQTHDIIHKYQIEKISQNKIAQAYNVSKTAIRNVLLKNNVQMRDNSKEIPEEIVEQILDRYVNGHYGLQSAGAPWGYGQKVVETLLKKAGIKKRNYTESKQITRLYPLDDNFFTVQSSDMAYILGFIASDGNVALKENSISIQLQKSDEQILQDIKEITKSTRPLDYYLTNAGNETVKFQVWSAEWKKDLAIYNIVPHKTFILKPPIYLDPKYYIDYIRGYFDGDGSVSYRKDNVKHCSWEIIGMSKEMIEWINNVLYQQYGIISTSGVTMAYTEHNEKVYKIGYYTTEKLQKIYNALYYDDNCLCLKRKKEKFETILK